MINTLGAMPKKPLQICSPFSPLLIYRTINGDPSRSYPYLFCLVVIGNFCCCLPHCDCSQTISLNKRQNQSTIKSVFSCPVRYIKCRFIEYFRKKTESKPTSHECRMRLIVLSQLLGANVCVRAHWHCIWPTVLLQRMSDNYFEI